MTADPLAALRRATADLTARSVGYAVVGGFGVSLRAEVRFTRDVDLALDMPDDEAVEALVRDFRNRRYDVLAIVEHEDAQRVATVRMRSPSGVTVDLLTASSGIEHEIVFRATTVSVEGAGEVFVAQPEELLSMKVLSMDARRLQDRMDARSLIEVNPNLDLERVRENLRRIEERGFHRRQDLNAKLEEVLRRTET
jgi:nucleotidyltransferase AbiEii toxin of type IV toxin-antitoxin system